MVIKEKLITADEFWQMILKGEIDEKGTELIEGILHPMPPTGWEHGNIASELDMIIRMFVKKHKLGKTTAAETGFRLEKDVVVAPDVAFIRADRIPDEIPQGFVPFAPDFAVEVMSPNNTATEMSRKVDLLAKHGTKLIWIVHPSTKKVDVYQVVNGTVKIEFLSIKDTLTGGDILPGFKLALSDLFDA